MHKPVGECLKARIWLSATTQDKVFWLPRVTCRQITVMQELLLSYKSKEKHTWPHSEPSTPFFYNLWCLMLCIKAMHMLPRTQGPTLSLSQTRFSWLCNEEKQIKMLLKLCLWYSLVLCTICIIQMSHKLLPCIKTHLGKNFFHWHCPVCLDSVKGCLLTQLLLKKYPCIQGKVFPTKQATQ